ncbi:hypothetical protein CMO92_03335 [Candidatus Woesearchaeota archaeon]|nr:hypothetical protein [Candidatus Woesearchaeota archaeon]
MVSGFEGLRDFFCEVDRSERVKGRVPYAQKEGRIWGVSSLESWFSAFERIGLERFDRFVDLGSGDGRVVFLASLFTEAVGIEMDDELVERSRLFKGELEEKGLIPRNRIVFEQGDYLKSDLSGFDCVGIFPDRSFLLSFQRKLAREVKGVVLVYERLHLPSLLGKGVSVGAEDLPVFSFDLRSISSEVVLKL